MDGKSKIAVRLNMLGCACVDMPVGYGEPVKPSDESGLYLSNGITG